MRSRLWWLGILSAGMFLIAAIVPPIPQPQAYHQFADARYFFGIPNFCDVTSGVAFLFVGVAGLRFLLDPCGWGQRGHLSSRSNAGPT